MQEFRVKPQASLKISLRNLGENPDLLRIFFPFCIRQLYHTCRQQLYFMYYYITFALLLSIQCWPISWVYYIIIVAQPSYRGYITLGTMLNTSDGVNKSRLDRIYNVSYTWPDRLQFTIYECLAPIRRDTSQHTATCSTPRKLHHFPNGKSIT